MYFHLYTLLYYIPVMVELYSQVLKDDYNSMSSDWKVTGISAPRTEALNETGVIYNIILKYISNYRSSVS